MIDLRALATTSASTTVVDVREALAGAHRVDSVAVDARDTLGEHPVWHAAARQMVWVDIAGHRVHRWDPETGEHRTTRTSLEVSLAWPTSSGGLLLATAAGVVVHGRDAGGAAGAAADDAADCCAGGRADAMPSRPSGMPATHRFNDGACDSSGRLWIATMSATGLTDLGMLLRVTPAAARAGEVEFRAVLSGVSCGNGIGWSPDGTLCYFIESISRTVFRFAVDPVTGALSDGEPFIRFTAPGMLPDGLTVDVRGDLWVAVWEGGCLLRFTSDGEPRGAWSFPTPRVTCPGFGPPGSNTLYVTSARPDAGYDVSCSASATPMRDDGSTHTGGHQPRDCAGALFSFNAGLDGVPVTAFDEGDTQ